MTTVWISEPYAAYPRNPKPAKRTATTNITPDRTGGNLCGSRIDSVMGMTLRSAISRKLLLAHSPIPSKANTAVPMSKGKDSLLNHMTSARPCFASTVVSLTPI